MSRENVEVVRRWYTMLPDLREVGPADDPAFADRAFGVFLDDEYELQLPGGYPEGEPVFRGREGLAQIAAMLRSAWSEWRFEVERFLDAGDRVVVFVRVIARGRPERSLRYVIPSGVFFATTRRDLVSALLPSL